MRSADEHTNHILGKFSLGERCENCDGWVWFVDLSRLVVTNIRSQLKKHPPMWDCNDGRTVHQIDCLLVFSRWLSSIEDCRAYRGGVMRNANGTNHRLVSARLRLHPSESQKAHSHSGVDRSKLTIPHKVQALSKAIASRLSEIDGDYSIDELETGLKVSGTLLQQLDKTKRKRRHWISVETLS